MNILCAILLAAMPELFGQKLMVDQNNNVYPAGSVLGLSQVAELAASNQIAQAKIDMVQEVQESTSREVDLVVGTLTGVNAYAYVEDFVESLGGVSAVSTNAACYIAKFQVGARKEIIDGVSYSCQELYYYYNEPMNNTPYITFQSALETGSTNEWDRVELQDITYLGTYTLDGIEYENMYRSDVWTLTDLDKNFYRVDCEVSAPSGDGSTFDVVGGITIGGEKGDTEEFRCMGLGGNVIVLTFKGGLLVRKEEYTPEQWAAMESGEGD